MARAAQTELVPFQLIGAEFFESERVRLRLLAQFVVRLK